MYIRIAAVNEERNKCKEPRDFLVVSLCFFFGSSFLRFEGESKTEKKKEKKNLDVVFSNITSKTLFVEEQLAWSRSGWAIEV
jgi:hypothetical protein